MSCPRIGGEGSGLYIPQPESTCPKQDKKFFEDSLSNARARHAAETSPEGPGAAGGAGGAGGPGNAGEIAPLNGGGGSSATALDGKVTISGPGAEKVAEAIETLYEKSPTFKKSVDAALANGETAQININQEAGTGTSGVSSLGKGNEDITLNIGSEASDESVLALVSHELGGHAFGDHNDGSMGAVGANQTFNSQVGYELGYLTSPAAQTYGSLWG